MLMSGDVPQGSLCTTNEVSALIEDLQYTLGEGPCVDAYRHDQVVLEPDLANPAVARWSAFSPPALGAGVRAVFGFPFRMGGARLGAVNLYRDRPGPLTDDQHADALVMADVVATWVLDVQAGAPDGDLAGQARGRCRLPLHRAERRRHGLGPARCQRHGSAHPAAGLCLQPRPISQRCRPGHGVTGRTLGVRWREKSP